MAVATPSVRLTDPLRRPSVSARRGALRPAPRAIASSAAPRAYLPGSPGRFSSTAPARSPGSPTMPGPSAPRLRHRSGPATGTRSQPKPRLLHQKLRQTTPPAPLSGRTIPQVHADNKIKQFTCRHLQRIILHTLIHVLAVWARPDVKDH
ncbi:hypothetical protein NDU88_001683 [Pleurodeles waltl]|uniref:Uncharacterized protein n=1 Tax=Pleurodeles waltl TaxID=8319 RepID=A0AAV7R7U1_PLEWA|nr:hypothetical protein NDU88_001683 [Pleurodeles waltl]